MRDAHQKQVTLGLAAGLLALFGTQGSIFASDLPKPGADAPQAVAAAKSLRGVRVSMLMRSDAEIDRTSAVPVALPVSRSGAAVGAAAKRR